MKPKLLLLIVIISSFISTSSSAVTIHVDSANGSNSNNGLSWALAFRTLGFAVRQAHINLTIDTILVTRGMYFPEYTSGVKTGSRDRAFTFTRSNLVVMGGYPFGGAGARNPDLNRSILSGNLGNLNTNTDNAYHVIVAAGSSATPINPSLILDGFFVRGATADGPPFHDTVSGEPIEGDRGGGMLNSYASPTIRNCTFNNNRARFGAGMRNRDSAPLVTNCIFQQNHAEGSGGAISNAFSSSGSYTNCVITGNRADNFGGGIYCEDAIITVYNSTIAGNYSNTSGGAIALASSQLIANSCIVWGNNSGIQLLNSSTISNAIITRSIVTGGYVGTGNSGADPQFLAAVAPSSAPTLNGNYRVIRCSPAVNFGDTTGYGQLTPLIDIDGNPRFKNNIDAGAYEHQTFVPTSHLVYVDSAATREGTGSSWASPIRSLAAAIHAKHDLCSIIIDTILVAKGTYYPEYQAVPSGDIRHTAFTFTRDSLVLLGGYQSGGGVRDWNKYPTIMSGDIGVSNDASDNTYHVLVTAGANIDSTLRLDGFTIGGGNADGGGAFFTLNGFSPVYNDRGAGWVNGLASPMLRNVKVISNQAAYEGGGVYNVNGSPIVSYLTISGNTAATDGGGWFNDGGDPIVLNARISGNVANNGGGWCNSAGNPVISNMTLAGNSAVDGLQLFTNNSSPAFYNSILAGAIPNNISALGANKSSFAYSILERGSTNGHWLTSVGTDGGGNRNVSPLFVNAVQATGTATNDGDYRIKFCSQAINNGNNAFAAGANNTTDVMGNPRIIGGTIDIGAYEKQSDVSAGNWGNNAALTNSSNNSATMMLTGCTDNGWTYYAAPNNPDSLSFAINWGANSTATRTAGNLRLTVDANNTIESNVGSAIGTMKRYWNVQLAPLPLTGPVSVRFFFNPADTVALRNQLLALSIGTPGSLRWFKTNSNSFSPSLVTTSAINGGAITMLTPTYGIANNVVYAEFNNITSFSGGTAMMSINSSPLPVQLISFNVEKRNEQTVELTWEVAVEELDGYNILRSTNGIGYETIEKVPATSKLRYAFTDHLNNNPTDGSTLYYKLGMEENNGTISYSKVQTVNLLNRVHSVTITPNPAANFITVNDLPADMIGREIQVKNALGGEIARMPAAEDMRIDISKWPAGLYLFQLPNGEVRKVVKH